MKKRILCFGDSHVFGTSPDGGARQEKRWPCVLAERVGGDCTVIEEGLSGRALSTKTPHRNGMEHLRIALESHRPIDICIVMIGTTDSKTANRRDTDTFLRDIENALGIISQFSQYRNSGSAKVMWVLPPHLGNFRKAVRSEEYDSESAPWLESIRKNLREYLEEKSIMYIDVENLEAGNDGIHLTEESHMLLAGRIAEKLQQMTE
jgi:lysophospholipase L1-like esterase